MAIMNGPDLLTAIKTKIGQGGYTFINSHNLEVKKIVGTEDGEGGFEALVTNCNEILSGRTQRVTEMHEDVKVLLPFPAIIAHMNRYWLIIPQGDSSAVYGLISFNENIFATKAKYGRDVVNIYEPVVKIGVDGSVAITAPAAGL